MERPWVASGSNFRGQTMAKDYCILRTEKISKIGSVISAVQHELRTRPTDNADPEQIKQNVYSLEQGYKIDPEVLGNFADRKNVENQAIAKYKKLLPEKMKEDNVTCIQVMVTYSPNAKVKARQYFLDAEKWVREKFGSDNVFFKSIHYDETTPHCNFFVVPGYDFKYKDGHSERRLSAKKWLGGRKKLSELQDSFYENVGKIHNLERGEKGSKAKHQDIKKWYQKFNEFCKDLQIEPQRENETVEEYFKRAAARWNFYEKNFNKLDKATKAMQAEHDFYQKYHDNLPALQEYVRQLETRSQTLKKGRSEEFSGRGR